MKRQIILDTETTGLNPQEGHRIIEIGCIEMINRRLTGEHFHYYLNPERDIDPGAVAVHGIRLEDLKDKPLFSEIIDELIHFIQGGELVIHNAPFDVGFLDYEIGLLNGEYKTIQEYCQILDTLVLARQLHPGQKNSLDALCKRYHVDNSERQWHGALLDAEILAEVYLRLTGGQTSLFGQGENQPQSQSQSSAKQSIDSRNMLTEIKIDLPVIAATEEELQAHKEILKGIYEEAGLCVWVSQEE